MSFLKILSRKLARFFDEFSLAARGVILASRKKYFYLPAIFGFLIFSFILNLFSGGFTTLNLVINSDFSGALKIIGTTFLGIFGINKNFLDWFPLFLMSVLQGILIGLVFFIYKKNKEKAGDIAGNAGIVAGLAILGSGCPTCGTTLLAPLLGTIFSGSSIAISGTVSGIITFLAVFIALLTFKKVGFETYAIIKSEEYERKKKEKINEKTP